MVPGMYQKLSSDGLCQCPKAIHQGDRQAMLTLWPSTSSVGVPAMVPHLREGVRASEAIQRQGESG